MLYWLYDIPSLLAVGLFAALFVGVCWIGIVLLSSRLVPLVHHQPGLNEILGDYLAIFWCLIAIESESLMNTLSPLSAERFPLIK